jgi:putative DNA primase/helicase
MESSQTIPQITACNESTIGELYHHLFAGLRYRLKNDQWLEPDGFHWKIGNQEILNRDLSALQAQIKRDYNILEENPRNILNKLNSSNGIRDIKYWLNSMPDLLIETTQLNAHKYILPLANGAYDMQEHEFIGDEQSCRELLFTRHMPVQYNPQAQCLRFRQFLEEIMLGDQELIRYLLKLIAQALLGDPKEDIVVFFIGSHQNGKTTLLQLLAHIFKDFYATVSPSLLVHNKQHSGSERWEKACLEGARIAVIDELDQGCEFNCATFKQLSSAGTIKVERKYSDPRAIPVTHSLFVSTNHMPVPTGDPAIRRRIIIIPFDYVVPNHLKNINLANELIAESEGILLLLLQALQQYQKEGLEPKPAKVHLALVKHKLSDGCQMWLEEHYSKSAEADKIALSTIHEDYKAWCNAAEQDLPESCSTPRKFAARLRTLGFKVERSTNNQSFVWGIKAKQACIPPSFSQNQHIEEDCSATG